jgi:hypothetical protein
MSDSYGGYTMMSDEELEELYERSQIKHKRERGARFWIAMFLVLCGLDLVACFYTGYRVVLWVSGYIWKVL